MFLLLLLLCRMRKSKVDTTKTKDIEGVVVTALGNKEKALGYSSQKLRAMLLQTGCTNTETLRPVTFCDQVQVFK